MLCLGVLTAFVAGISRAGFIVLANTVLSQGVQTHRTSIYWLVAICLAMPVTRFLCQFLMVTIAQHSTYRLTLGLTGAILAAPLRQVETIGIPPLQAVLTRDIGTIIDGLMSLPTLLLNVTVLAGCLAYIGWLSRFVLLVVLGSLALNIVIYSLMGKWTTVLWTTLRDEVTTLFRHYHVLLLGLKELKMNRERRDSFFSKYLTVCAKQCRNHYVKAATVSGATWGMGEFQFMLLILFVAIVLPTLLQVKDGHSANYVITLLFMMGPIDQINSLFPTITRANVALQQIGGLALPIDAPREPEEPAAAGKGWSRLTLRGVSHSYRHGRDEKTFTLGPLDLSFSRGDIVFVMGGNGSGKTTLVKLLVGLYVPESGQVCLDGCPVTDATRDEYRERFSVIFSDCFIFQDLVGVGGPEGDERAREHARALRLHEKIQIQDGMLSTTALSQGQRKRLALLNAYLEDRPIYVFDEWAADQDPFFRETFYLKLLPELKAKRKTVFVVSHDDRYCHVADRVIKLDYGTVESDTLQPHLEEASVQSNGAS